MKAYLNEVILVEDNEGIVSVPSLGDSNDYVLLDVYVMDGTLTYLYRPKAIRLNRLKTKKKLREYLSSIVNDFLFKDGRIDSAVYYHNRALDVNIVQNSRRL